MGFARPLHQPRRHRLPAGRPLRALPAGGDGALRPALHGALSGGLRLPLLQALRLLRRLRPLHLVPRRDGADASSRRSSCTSARSTPSATASPSAGRGSSTCSTPRRSCSSLLDALFLLPVVSPRLSFLSGLFPDDFPARLWLAEVDVLHHRARGRSDPARAPLLEERVGHRAAAVEVGGLGLGAGGAAVHALLRGGLRLRRRARHPRQRDGQALADGRGHRAARAHPAHVRQLGRPLPPDGRGHGRAPHGRLRADDARHRPDARHGRLRRGPLRLRRRRHHAGRDLDARHHRGRRDGRHRDDRRALEELPTGADRPLLLRRELRPAPRPAGLRAHALGDDLARPAAGRARRSAPAGARRRAHRHLHRRRARARRATASRAPPGCRAR